MTNLLFTMLITSFLISTILICVVLIVKKIFVKHISVRWQYNICFLIIIILVLPFIPLRQANLEKLYNLVLVDNTIDIKLGKTYDSDNVENILNSVNAIQDFAYSMNTTLPTSVIKSLMLIWFIGVFFNTVTNIICTKRIDRIIKGITIIQESKINNLFKKYKSELGLKNNIILCKSSLIKSPMALGLFKIYVLIPSEIALDISEKEFECIILHELYHCKNKDLIINYLICFLQILYWYNLIVLHAFKVMRTDREILCDSLVLKKIGEENGAAYGKIILNFAQKLSQPLDLILNVDMISGKKQITKRIESILSYKIDSTWLKLKSGIIFIIVFLIITTKSPQISLLALGLDKYDFTSNKNTTYENLSKYFEGFDASFVLYDLKQDKYIIHNKDKSKIRVSPDSTYKIYSTLIALELGKISKDDSTIYWDGTLYPYKQWNKDQDIYSAMRDSVNWYFQTIDKLSKPNNIKSYLKNIKYGNFDISGGISNYWSESSLLISPIEQIELLKKFYLNKLPFKVDNIEVVKDAIKLSKKGEKIMFGKTGTGSTNTRSINGWFIGYVEDKENTYIFATNINSSDGASGSIAANITLSILKDKNIY